MTRYAIEFRNGGFLGRRQHRSSVPRHAARTFADREQAERYAVLFPLAGPMVVDASDLPAFTCPICHHVDGHKLDCHYEVT